MIDETRYWRALEWANDYYDHRGPFSKVDPLLIVMTGIIPILFLHILWCGPIMLGALLVDLVLFPFRWLKERGE